MSNLPSSARSRLGGAVLTVGAVLIGGRSQRFGNDKALADVGGRPLGAIVVDALRGAGLDPVVAVGGTAGAQLGLPTIADRHRGEGPLAALATVLLWAKTGSVVVVPCDLPLLESDHIVALVDGLKPGRAAIAALDGHPQASLGCWPTSFAPALQRAVADGARAWRDALEVGPYDLVALPAPAFADADTPEELANLVAEGADEGLSAGEVRPKN